MTDCLAPLSYVPTIVAPEPKPYWEERRIRLAEDYDAEAWLYIGDSYFERMVIRDGANFGIGGESLRALLTRLGDCQAIHNAKGVVLCAGFNDLANMGYYPSWQNAVAAIDYMYSILEQAMQGKWVISKLLPVGVNCIPVSNIAISAVNANLQARFGAKPNVALVDIGAQLAPNGYLLPEYHIGDDIHPSPAANAIWRAAILAERESLGV